MSDSGESANEQENGGSPQKSKERALLEDSSSTAKACKRGDKNSHSTVTLPVADFNAMKQQNERILSDLARLLQSQSSAKRKYDSDPDSGEEVISDSENEHESHTARWTPPKKHKKQNDKKRSRKRKYESHSDSEEGEISDSGNGRTHHSDHCVGRTPPEKHTQQDDSDEFDDQIGKLVAESNSARQEALDSSGSHLDCIELDDIAQEYEVEEDVGPEIAENVAKVINTMAKGKMSDEKLKQKMNKHRPPKNCNISVPRVNSEIWESMDHSAKSRDLRMQAIQKIMMRAGAALAQVANECLGSTPPDSKSLVWNIMDAIGLVMKASHDLSMERRNRIVSAPQMNKKYRKLASGDIPVTERLFGDDLKAACASIDSTSKLGKNFIQAPRGRKFFSFQNRPKNWENPPRRAFQGRSQGLNLYRGRTQQKGRGSPYRGRGRSSYALRKEQME